MTFNERHIGLNGAAAANKTIFKDVVPSQSLVMEFKNQDYCG